MGVDSKIVDGLGKGNRVHVDKHNAIAVFDQFPALPEQGTPNRQQFYRSVLEDMNVNGAVTNVEFKLEADQDHDIHILFFNLVIEDTKVKEEKYGNINITNGVDMIINEGGVDSYLVQNAAAFSEVAHQTGAQNTDPKAKTSGDEVGFLSFDISSVFPRGIRLGRGTTDHIKFVVKDDLTGLIDHKLYLVGYKHVK